MGGRERKEAEAEGTGTERTEGVPGAENAEKQMQRIFAFFIYLYFCLPNVQSPKKDGQMGTGMVEEEEGRDFGVEGRGEKRTDRR